MIRTGTLDDIESIVGMSHHFLDSTAYGGLVPADAEALERLVRLVLNLGVVFLADGDTGIVGMIALVALDHPVSGQKVAEEMVWWVEPASRSGLTGPKLLRHAEEWARAQSCAMLKMVAPHGSDVGVFLGRVSYQPIETAFVKRLD